MIKKVIIFLLIMIVCFAVSPAKGASKEAEEGTEIEALKKKCKKRIIAAPILFYTPETRLAYGAAGSYIFRMAGCKKDSRPSSISPVIIYTQEKQFKAQLNTDLFFKDNKYRLKTEIKTEKYPNKFYGVGDNTLEENEELYTSRSTDFLVSFLKMIGKGFNLGLRYHFTDWEIVETEEQGQLVTGLVPGSSDGTLSGVGLLANRDTRDNIFFPLKGDFFELDARFYRKFLGSKFNFTSLTLNLRKYVTLFSSHVFAVQSLVKIQTGTVPFLHLSKMGGQYNMRGYFEGRFRDKNMMVFQAEYRMPLFWRFGLVGFAGLGNVAEKFNQLNLGELKSSYGFGLRFLFDKKEKIQVRMDIGFGEDSSGFYFSIFEAF